MEPVSRTAAAGRVLVDFQSVMEQFLEIEQHVLGLYSRHETRVPSARREPRERRAAGSSLSLPLNLPVPDTSTIAQPGGVMRLTPRAVMRPAPETRVALARDHVVLLTDDGRGVCTGLADRLRATGHRVAIVSRERDGAAGDTYYSALDSEADVDRLVQQIASDRGPIAALVHLVPLSATPRFDDVDVAAWTDRLAAETRSLFLLAKALRAPLQGAAGSGALVAAVTAMGGAFGCEHGAAAHDIFPGSGGVAGFLKCLALEWPTVRVKAIDVDGSDALDVLTRQIFEELWIADTSVEVGYIGGRRMGLEMSPLPATTAHPFAIGSDSVVLATGGARGITAEVCLELAERYQPTFVLVGRSPLPEPLERPDTSSLTSSSDLKKALAQRLRAGDPRVTPVTVEKAYQRLIREREVRRTMSALVAAGSRVHYVALDVQDWRALGTLIDDIYAAYGRIDGVIHGAGVIEDKLVEHKTVESFDRVFATKTISAFALSRQLRLESLRFAVFFTSVAGRFGNRGQADYAAANEVVNKLARVISLRCPNRVCAVNWAPWDATGMVTPELRREFEQRGVSLLQPVDGRRAFWEEIQQQASDPAEVVIAGVRGMTLSAPAPVPPAVQSLPLLNGAQRRSGAAGAVQYMRPLDPAVDLPRLSRW
ncbi:MAG: hypothetical protein DMF87_19075 [Acidobacteria bacterium]|nr:MAG: hypothetical protein DMF87_19075 [Acidobacteriota bacterium]